MVRRPTVLDEALAEETGYGTDHGRIGSEWPDWFMLIGASLPVQRGQAEQTDPLPVDPW